MEATKLVDGAVAQIGESKIGVTVAIHGQKVYFGLGHELKHGRFAQGTITWDRASNKWYGNSQIWIAQIKEAFNL